MAKRRFLTILLSTLCCFSIFFISINAASVGTSARDPDGYLYDIQITEDTAYYKEGLHESESMHKIFITVASHKILWGSVTLSITYLVNNTEYSISVRVPVANGYGELEYYFVRSGVISSFRAPGITSSYVNESLSDLFDDIEVKVNNTVTVNDPDVDTILNNLNLYLPYLQNISNRLDNYLPIKYNIKTYQYMAMYNFVSLHGSTFTTDMLPFIKTKQFTQSIIASDYLYLIYEANWPDRILVQDETGAQLTPTIIINDYPFYVCTLDLPGGHTYTFLGNKTIMPLYWGKRQNVPEELNNYLKNEDSYGRLLKDLKANTNTTNNLLQQLINIFTDKSQQPNQTVQQVTNTTQEMNQAINTVDTFQDSTINQMQNNFQQVDVTSESYIGFFDRMINTTSFWRSYLNTMNTSITQGSYISSLWIVPIVLFVLLFILRG